MPWQGLTVRHLLAFLAVADEGTFSRASEQLGYTQSAVSQQVAALERMVGARLLERPGGPRPVTLTPEGAAMAAHAKVMLGQLDEAAAELRALTSGEGGTLRVGTVQSVGRRVLPALLGRFRQEHPFVKIDLFELEEPVGLLERLAVGRLDVFFAPMPLPQGPYETRHLLDDPFVLLAPAGSPEAARTSITIDEVVKLPLVGSRNPWCQGLQNDRFAGTDVTPRILFESDDNGTSQGLVGAGGINWFTSLLSVDPEDSQTVIVPIDPPVEPRRLAVLWSADRHLPAALGHFVDTATQVSAEIARDLRPLTP